MGYLVYCQLSNSCVLKTGILLRNSTGITDNDDDGNHLLMKILLLLTSTMAVTMKTWIMLLQWFMIIMTRLRLLLQPVINIDILHQITVEMLQFLPVLMLKNGNFNHIFLIPSILLWWYYFKINSSEYPCCLIFVKISNFNGENIYIYR